MPPRFRDAPGITDELTRAPLGNDWAEVVERYPALEPLTTRQAEVVRRMAAGETVAEVATALGIVPDVVGQHRCRARDRLGLPRARYVPSRRTRSW